MHIRALYRSRRLKRMLIILGIILVSWFLFLWFIQRLMLFPVWMIPPAKNTPAPANAKVMWLEPEGASAGTKVEAWLFTGDGVTAEHPGPLVIYAHGNAELIDFWSGELNRYLHRGVSVLMIEYRGYGRSTGSPSQANIVADYTAMYDKAIALPEVDDKRVIFHGRSLGGGILGALTADRPPAALILESTFTGVAPMALRYTLPWFLVRDPLDTRQTLRQFKGPVLIIHGERDEVIPVRHARNNHQACPQSQLFIDEHMSHNSGPTSNKKYWQAIFDFLDKADVVEKKSSP